MSGPSSAPCPEALIRAAAALGARAEAELRLAMQDASDADLGPELEEVLLQSYLFAGYPVALSAFATWRDVSGRPPPLPAKGSWQTWTERGEAVFAEVYGNQYQRVRANVRALHPDLERWMVTEGYGKVLGRVGLSLIWRELTIVAQLAVMDLPRQLYSHLRGALQVGASRASVERALDIAMEFEADGRRRETVYEVWSEVVQRTSLNDTTAEERRGVC